jgi:AraC family transcriptional regulator
MASKHELNLDFRDDAQPVETNATKSWHGISVQYSRLKLPSEYEFQWDGRCHYLAYHDLILLDGEMEVAGDKPIAGADLRGQLTFVPEGQGLTGWAKPADRINAFTVVYFEPSAMREELQTDFPSLEAQPSIYFRDELLGATMKKLATMMADEQRPVSQMYAETLGLTAALEMFRLAQEGSIAPTSIASGNLGRSRQDLVLNYIAENLGRDFGLDELASLCGLTRFHFARAFKATFSETPHQYVLSRRLERAMNLLAKSRLPISEIASVTGFGGTSQFARSFKAATGKTPLEFRRSA